MKLLLKIFLLFVPNLLVLILLWHLVRIIQIELREEDHRSGIRSQFSVNLRRVRRVSILGLLLRFLKIGAGAGIR